MEVIKQVFNKLFL